MFPVFMVIVAIIGGWWLFSLSDRNNQEASVMYGICAALWCAACLVIAAINVGCK